MPHAGPHERLGSTHSSHASGAVSIPDTLSEHTPLATPRAESDGAALTWMEAMSDPVHVTPPLGPAPAASTVPESQSPHAVPGEVAPHAVGDVTPGYSPSLQPACSRGRLEAPEHACSAGAWQQAGAHADAPAAPVAWQHFLPPAEPPGEPYSWLFVSLLHAGAGTLNEAAANAWQQQPQTGTRFAELAGALRRAPAALPSSILRLLTAELACVDRDPAPGAAAGDFGDTACPPARRSRHGRRARRAPQARSSLPRQDADSPATDDQCVVPTCPEPAAVAMAETWLALDGVDLESELRHPAPTLQDAPPFMRPAVRGALVQALRQMRNEHARGGAESEGAARA